MDGEQPPPNRLRDHPERGPPDRDDDDERPLLEDFAEEGLNEAGLDIVDVVNDGDNDDEFVGDFIGNGQLLLRAIQLHAQAPLAVHDDDDDDDDELDTEEEDVEINNESNEDDDTTQITNDDTTGGATGGANPPFTEEFDKALPAAHSYLGTDLDEYHGRTFLEEHSYQSLPIMTHPEVVLFPGQTLPLNLFRPTDVAAMKQALQTDRTFGVITILLFPDRPPKLANIGTTAEIISAKMENEHGIETMRVIAVGRQRFEIAETRTQVNGVVAGKVKILPEIIIPDALRGVGSQFHRNQAFITRDMASVHTELDSKMKRALKNKFACANFTWWPPWVYSLYDETLLMRLIKLQLLGWNASLKEENMPRGASAFSFWVATNIPVEDSTRLKLLAVGTSVQRLRAELNILKKCTIFVCKQCSRPIANKTEVFSMSVNGPMGAYVNPGGHIHETLTVYKVTGLSLHGHASWEHSWFPGYSWTIAQCRGCSNHMGWKFKADKKSLKPEKFWGLCRASLKPVLEKDSNIGF